MVVRSVLLAAAAMVFTAPASAEEHLRWLFSTGVDFDSGDFGSDQNTDVITVPFSAKAYYGDWNVRVAIPWLSIHGPANVVFLGDEGGEIGGLPGTNNKDTHSGFGDTAMTVTHSWNRIGGTKMYFDLKGLVYAPTGDQNEGLGVGAWDFGVDGELGAAWPNTAGVYVSLGRRFRGDSDTFERRDGWVTSTGGWVRISEPVDVGAFYDWREHSLQGFEARQSAGGFVSYRFTKEFQMQGTVAAGLSDTAPNIEVGLRFYYRPDWS